MIYFLCCGSDNFFSGSGSADPVLKIWIRVTLKRPNPGDPKKAGSGSYLDMFDVKQNKYFLLHFLYQHLMTLKIKDNIFFDIPVF